MNLDCDQKKNLLIIEDDHFQLEMFKNSLSFFFHLNTSDSFSDAVKVITSKWPDLVLTDEKLIDGSGLDLLKLSKKINQNIRSILITGYSSENLAIKCLHAGIDYYFKKPIELKTVIEKCRQLALPYDKNNLLINKLTKREKEILEFIINGLKPELISEELIISIQTVRTHVRNIHRKLKCNRTEEIILKYRV